MHRTITYKTILAYSLFWISNHYAMENSIMTPITRWNHVEPFAGNIVAYTANSPYFDGSPCDYGYILSDALPNTKYGYIKPRIFDWPNDKGYVIHLLLPKKNHLRVNCKALINSRLARDVLYMRNITPQEGNHIALAVRSNKAEFEYLDEKDVEYALQSIIQ